MPVCRNCNRGPVNRPRGLCWSCYYTPGVRDQYPSTSKFARPRKPQPWHGAERRQGSTARRMASVQLDLRDVLTGEGVRRRKPQDERVIESRTIRRIQELAPRSDTRRRELASRHRVECAGRVRSRDANHSDSRDARLCGEGIDRVGRRLAHDCHRIAQHCPPVPLDAVASVPQYPASVSLSMSR